MAAEQGVVRIAKQVEWELYDLDKYTGVFPTKQIQELTGISYSNLVHRIGADQCGVFKKRWRIQRVSKRQTHAQPGETWADWWTEEWNRAVEAIKAKGCDLDRIRIARQENGGGAGGQGKKEGHEVKRL